jgi:hypothetical protein
MAKRTIFLILLLGLFACVGNPRSGGDIAPPAGEHPAPDTIPCYVKPDTTDGGGVSIPIKQQLITLARTQIGVRQMGDNTGPEVDMYLASAGLGPGHPWCAAFIGWLHKQVGLLIPQSAAWSPSWFPSRRVIPNEQAQKGDVGGIYFRTLGRIAHVFMYDEPYNNGSNFITTIEGNTNEDGSRNGHSVLRKKRSKNTIHKTSNWVDT